MRKKSIYISIINKSCFSTAREHVNSLPMLGQDRMVAMLHNGFKPSFIAVLDLATTGLGRWGGGGDGGILYQFS